LRLGFFVLMHLAQCALVLLADRVNQASSPEAALDLGQQVLDFVLVSCDEGHLLRVALDHSVEHTLSSAVVSLPACMFDQEAHRQDLVDES